ncbi:MAG: helix-turn-helix domain-containing protein [Thermosynechococcaceae cyanobacterium]
MTNEDRLATVLDNLNKTLQQILMQNQPQIKNELTLTEAAELLGVHVQTIHKYRKESWQEGVHYFPQGKGHLYNRELLEDWRRNRTNPAQHQLAIAAWIQNNQPKKKLKGYSHE